MKLRPTMESGLRRMADSESGLNRGAPAKRTIDALISRGLLVKMGRWVSVSKAGHEWLEANHTKSMQALCDVAAKRAFMNNYMGSPINAELAWLASQRPTAEVPTRTLAQDRAELADLIISAIPAA